MFPPILKQPPSKMKHEHLIDDSVLATPTVQDDSDESSWDSDKEKSYMEFNVEPKILVSSQQSSRLTKQLPHYDSFENVDRYGENEWKDNYEDEILTADDNVDNYTKDIFNEINEMENNFSDDNDSIENSNHLNGIELINPKE